MNADGVRGHLEITGGSNYVPGIYEKFVKRGIDIVLSFGGLIVLSPVFALIALAIVIEDSGQFFYTKASYIKIRKIFITHEGEC